GIVNDHRHFHRKATLGDARAGAAKADDEYGLAEKVDRYRGQAFGPAVGAHERVKLASSFCEREHEEKRVLGDRGGVRGPPKHQRNSAAGERWHANGVIPDPYAATTSNPRASAHSVSPKPVSPRIAPCTSPPDRSSV